MKKIIEHVFIVDFNSDAYLLADGTIVATVLRIGCKQTKNQALNDLKGRNWNTEAVAERMKIFDDLLTYAKVNYPDIKWKL